MSTAADRRAYRGPALFSFGFRPFFLSAGVWAALTVPLWLTARIGLMPPSGIDRVWHAHEMLFGYLAAVVAGFLLTAVPNWTGRMPVLGRPLAALWALWLAGRLAMVTPWALSPWAWGLDSLFLLVFAGVIWREILSGRNWRNLGVAAMVSLLALAHLAFHLLPEASVPAAERAAVALAATLIALIGGRVTPSFTRNWLAPRGEADAVRTRPRLDLAGVIACALGGAAWTLWPQQPLAGAVLVIAGGLSLARLAGWGGLRTLSEPLVLVLHLGYLWLGLGLVLVGASALSPLVPYTAGLHALTAGAVGVMTLAMMTRASLGHTGRPRTAGPATRAVFWLANLAAVLRVAAGLGASEALLSLSGLAWTAAFGLFAVSYGPMLILPRRAA
ncbi:NnrS family protein [Phenylobacterium sp.]|uniref:NnrS family protein n=1 Tax=Phenylobacterium sp. TaxID=1871053 RepID=UPI0035B1E9E0